MAQVIKSRLGRLRLLNLAWNDIRDEGATQLAASLHAAPIVQLILEYNWISGPGVAAMASALRGNAHVRELRLASNNAGARGAGALANALRTNTALQRLDLYSNSLGTFGALALLPGLVGSHLKELNLAFNYIDADGGAVGAHALAEAFLNGAGELRRIDLRWNHFHQCRCGTRRQLRRAARRAPTILTLDLEPPK